MPGFKIYASTSSVQGKISAVKTQTYMSQHHSIGNVSTEKFLDVLKMHLFEFITFVQVQGVIDNQNEFQRDKLKNSSQIMMAPFCKIKKCK